MPKAKHLREIVEKLLVQERRCRLEPMWLTYRVLQVIAKKHGQKIFIPYNLFSIFPTPESVARCRRDIMNKEGKLSEEFIAEEGVTYEKPNAIQND